MNYFTLFFLCLVSLATSHAQTSLSLTDAITLGLKNRYDVQANQMNVSLAENSIDKSRNAWLPDIAVSGNVRYNTQLQTTVLPAGFGGSSEGQRLTLGTKNSTFFALDLTQPIYNPALKTDRRVAENNLALEREKNGQRQTNVKVTIAEAYLNVLLKEIQRDLARTDANRDQNYREIAENKFKLGALSEGDYLTAKLNHENALLTAQRTEQSYRAAQATLCYDLNIPTDTTLRLTDRIDSTIVVEDVAQNPNPVVNRTEVRQLAMQQQGYALQSRKVLDGLHPTLSAYGNYSTQFQANTFNYFTNAWNNFNFIGLKIALPITAQFTKKTNLATYRLYSQQTALTLKQTEADIQHDIAEARTDLINAATNLRSSQASLLLSRQLYDWQQEQYRLGARLYSQVLDTEKSLQTAEQNYLEAAYNYLVARLTYKKAVGLY